MVKKDLIKIISQASGVSVNATKKILDETDKQIIKGLKDTKKVQVRNFGTFKLKRVKSKTIYDISNKKGKIILLEGDLIKFMPSPIFKSKLLGTRPTAEKSIAEKLKSLIHAQGASEEIDHPDESVSPYAKVFSSIIRSCIKQDIPYLMFSVEENTSCFIYYSRDGKREVLTKIPTAIVDNYIKELLPKLDKHKPEEYFVKFAFPDNTSKINNKGGILRYWTYPANDKLLVRIQISNE